ncbi:MAG: hypothetical protein QM778_00545 [Myxococcales bacterium]
MDDEGLILNIDDPVFADAGLCVECGLLAEVEGEAAVGNFDEQQCFLRERMAAGVIAAMDPGDVWSVAPLQARNADRVLRADTNLVARGLVQAPFGKTIDEFGVAGTRRRHFGHFP